MERCPCSILWNLRIWNLQIGLHKWEMKAQTREMAAEERVSEVLSCLLSLGERGPTLGHRPSRIWSFGKREP
ncbi:rCG49753 [Rattus norvegicus]|uniref:RCG49753 n=1 Tax=Rattus norvegicus TaxID=10116 RepID=A6K4J1_RAT|nr:rCG49753 [Rattus norvegicus]